MTLRRPLTLSEPEGPFLSNWGSGTSLPVCERSLKLRFQGLRGLPGYRQQALLHV